ncbi:MAG: SWIM zinc finger family protein, partial [Deltaproteobacteria bacterium]|nr:SWIM zinc finger family protein [Deltaproteobacteria bacterium]
MSWHSRSSYHSFYFEPRKKLDVNKIKSERTDMDPVTIEGRTIASTFWGQRWCSHFENMADFENRLPRGRTYARQGSVVHLEINPGHVKALVAGSSLYSVNMEIAPLPQNRWDNIKRNCQGSISTIIDLLMGKISPDVMGVVCDPREGLFPTKSEIKYDCSCPDWASLCKHVAAVFYGIGNRLDRSPELLFLLRRVDPHELLASGASIFLEDTVTESDNLLQGDYGSIFGIDLASPEPAQPQKAKNLAARPKAGPENPASNLNDEELKETILKITQSRVESVPEQKPVASPGPKKRGRVPKKSLPQFLESLRHPEPPAEPAKSGLSKASPAKTAPVKASLKTVMSHSAKPAPVSPLPKSKAPGKAQAAQGRKASLATKKPAPRQATQETWPNKLANARANTDLAAGRKSEPRPLAKGVTEMIPKWEPGKNDRP